jgi:hypothetical protein
VEQAVRAVAVRLPFIRSTPLALWSIPMPMQVLQVQAV